MAAQSAISGLGFSSLSREAIGSSRDLAIEAAIAAVRDADLRLADVDGLLVTKSPSASLDTLPLHVREDLSLGPLSLLANVEGEGTSVVQAIQYATLAIARGMARHVVCVFADARIQGEGSAAGYARAMEVSGLPGWEAEQGLFGAVGPYALAASRWLHRTGQTQEDLGAYAIACRKWAALNPQAFLRKPLEMEAYLASRYVCEPLRLLDCAYAVNGAAAVVVSPVAQASSERSAFVHGMGQGHCGTAGAAGSESDGAAIAAAGAVRMAGIELRDIAMAQLYDPFSSVGLELLEAYGLSEPGRAGELVRSGATSPGGRLPVNTGGGQLSGFYLQGMTPVSEAVIQARGEGGARQAGGGPILVGGMGGCMEYHATLVLTGSKEIG
jgi:acetyl-CoA acetyltransferase